MIQKLPLWNVTNLQYAFNDMESKTGIEMTARLYGKMQELIESYNAFVTNINQSLEDFYTETNKNAEEFAVGLRQEFQDFIDVIELKIKDQDAQIADMVNYIKSNLGLEIQKVVKEMVEKGELSDEILEALGYVTSRLEDLEESQYKISYENETITFAKGEN